MFRAAITRIDLIVVLLAMSLLIQLAIPAMQYSREASRKSSCSHNLATLGKAALLHVDSQGHYPSGGWDVTWIGEPERGFGADQPGGWTYNILPYLEQGGIHSMGAGLKGAEREAAIRERCEFPVESFNCPARRPAVAYPHKSKTLYFTKGHQFQKPLDISFKTDFAACTGSLKGMTNFRLLTWKPPASLEEADSEDFLWPTDHSFVEEMQEKIKDMGVQVKTFTQKKKYELLPNYNGITFGRSATKPHEITAGLSKTFLLGDKAISTKHYLSGADKSDRQSMYVGFSAENCRTSGYWPADDFDKLASWRFGSVHTAGHNMLYADGSVESISYDVDKSLYASKGNKEATANAEQGL